MSSGQRTGLAWLGIVVVVLLVPVAGWLALHNPAIVDSNPGGIEPGSHCAAPYDTVLLGNDNYPGGGPWPDADEVAVQCRHAGRERFGAAVGLGLAAVALAGPAVALAKRDERADTR
jgi:hypothetical protein